MCFSSKYFFMILFFYIHHLTQKRAVTFSVISLLWLTILQNLVHVWLLIIKEVGVVGHSAVYM